ncbi:Lrp/AsnC family transcriptional regulator [Metabacillus litoralis]|uniref:Lrp/AsnC family transcriptional regulator n=1 Tax=Metabacillus TaxID=2675233 RepID=UPI000EF602A5|nr:Lrp/AsnC family transcriptional regulator [Metabacillus litoralis]MCM3165144.1 Lrp/AsnC family transcriptional regulator [Metabacillus litoralis]MCM3413718.1 Lrp/AsnC family transcriptional regulator [Metabacillus litoralis]UHA61774.1 Lrp/AsnC family transcriptional regulator [Metabacillus litoralis]
MDDVNRRILDILQVEGRISMTELGQKVSLSVPAVTERVRKLEDQGIIEGYKAQVNPEKLQKTVRAFILIKTHRCKAFREFCKESPLVIECHRLTGEYSYLVKVVTASYQLLEQFIDSSMEYGEPYTMINLSSPVPGKII